MKTLNKGAALACAAAVAGGTLFLAAPASAATSEDWAADSFAVDPVSNIWYTSPSATDQTRDLPARVTDTIEVTSVPDLFADGSVLTSSLVLPENVFTNPGNRNDAPAVAGGARISVTSGAFGVGEETSYGNEFRFMVSPEGADEVALASGSATITTDAISGLRFTTPGSYVVGDATIEVREYAPGVESGGGVSDEHDGYNYIRRDINPATSPEWGEDPTVSISIHDAAGTDPVYATYYTATGEEREIDLSGYSTADESIPLDPTNFVDGEGNYIPGVLEFSYPTQPDESNMSFGIHSSINTPYLNQASLVLHEGDTPPVENPDTIVVTPTAPTVNLEGATCDIPGEIIYPEIEGVEYGVVGGDQFSALVVATPLEGYSFPEGATTSWGLTTAPEDCLDNEQPAGPTFDVPETVEAADLVDGVEFPFTGFPAGEEVTFELWSGDDMLSSNTVMADENGAGVLVAEAYLDTAAGRAPVADGTEFRVIATSGFDSIEHTFVAVSGTDAPTDPETPGTPGGTVGDTPSGELAYTGGDISAPVIAGSIALLLAGGAALIAARRRAAQA